MSRPFVGRLDPPNYNYYLGDGVYATFDGFQVWITCGDYTAGGEPPGIALNREVIEKLVAYEMEAAHQYISPA